MFPILYASVEAASNASKAHILRGQHVRIPVGVQVRTTNPARREYISQRARTVKVHHTIRGAFYAVEEAILYYHHQLEHRGFDIQALYQWRSNNKKEARAMYIVLSPPVIVWAGQGRYWHEVVCTEELKIVDK